MVKKVFAYSPKSKKILTSIKNCCNTLNPFIVTVNEFVIPKVSAAHPEKINPSAGVADTETLAFSLWVPL